MTDEERECYRREAQARFIAGVLTERERFRRETAARVLAAIVADARWSEGSKDLKPKLALHAINLADALLAELERTAEGEK